MKEATDIAVRIGLFALYLAVAYAVSTFFKSDLTSTIATLALLVACGAEVRSVRGR